MDDLEVAEQQVEPITYITESFLKRICLIVDKEL